MNKIKELEIALKQAKEEERTKRQINYIKLRENRLKAKKAFNELKPKITKYLINSLKEGDIITCKGYNGYKKVVKVDGDSVYAMCGYFRKGEFIYNGSGSNTTTYYVTSILKNGVFIKVKDLI